MKMLLSSPGRLVLSILAVVAAFALASCGGDDESEDSGDLGPLPATVTPADAPLYLEAVVRPEGEQREAVLSAIGKLTGSDDPGGLIRGEVDESLSEEGFAYEEDVEPWLGQRAGLFVTDLSGKDGEGAAVIAVTDEDAAREAVQKAADADELTEEDASYEGVDYQVDEEGNAVGFVGEFLVAGTEKGFQAAVDGSSTDALANDSEAIDALDGAPGDSLFRSLIDADGLLDLAVEAGQISRRDLESAGEQLDQLREGPLVVSAQSTADSISIEATGPAGDGGETTDIVSRLPGDAWLGIGVPMVGEAIGSGFQSFIDSVQSSIDSSSLPPGAQVPDIAGEVERATGLDLSKDLDWAGDLGLFASGTSPLDLGGGLVIQTEDEDAAAATLEKLRKRLARERSVDISATADGFQISGLAGAPVGAEVVIRDGQVVVAVAGATVEEQLNPTETLQDSNSFNDAAGSLDGLDPAFYVDVQTIVSLLESTGQTSDPDFQQARPVLDALNFLVAGASEEGDRSIARFVLGLKEPESSSGTAAAITP